MKDMDEIDRKILEHKNRCKKIQQFLLDKQEINYLSKNWYALNEIQVPLSFEELHFYQYRNSVLQVGLRIVGSLDVSALVLGLETIVMRHDTLRTTYSEKNGKLSRDILSPEWFNVEQVELKKIEVSHYQSEIQKHARNDVESVVTFEKPLFRATLLHLTNENYVLLLSGHHMIFDGWAYGVFGRELSALYKAYHLEEPSPLASIDMQYSEYVQWQQYWYQTEEYKKIKRYWCKRLAGIPALIEFPTSRPRSKQGRCIAIRQIHVELSSELSEVLVKLIHQEGTTLFILMLTTISILLANFSNQSDILITYGKAGRYQAKHESMIGNFADLMLFRSYVDLQLSFKALLHQTSENALNDYMHGKIPFLLLKQLLQKLGCENYNLNQVYFGMQPNLHENSGLFGVEIEKLKPNEITAPLNEKVPRLLGEFDFSFSKKGKGIDLSYNAELYELETMEKIVDGFRGLLASVAKGLDRPLCELLI